MLSDAPEAAAEEPAVDAAVPVKTAPPPTADRRRPGAFSLAVRGVVAVAILAVGAAGAWALVATMPVIDLAPVEAVATPVIVFEPSTQPVARPWSGYGTAEAMVAADVPARVTATVASLGAGVRDGAAVEAGQTLVTLEREDFEDEVTRLQSLAADADARLRELDSREARLDEQAGFMEEDLQLQAQELERVERLEIRGVATGQDLDRARSQVLDARSALSAMRQSRETIPTQREALTATAASLEAQLRVARRNLGRTTIQSPIAGYVESLDVEPGEAVSPGERVARVVDPAVVEVPLKLPAGARRSVGVGDPVELRSSRDARERDGGAPAEGENPAWTATLVRINPTDDAQTRTLTVYVVLDQADTPAAERLAPGLFVAGTVTAGEATPRVVVPRRSLRRGRVQLVGPDAEGRPRVHSAPVSVDFNLRARLPGTGLPDDQWAVLSSPLPEGERVVLTANASLLDGQVVDPRDVASRGER